MIPNRAPAAGGPVGCSLLGGVELRAVEASPVVVPLQAAANHKGMRCMHKDVLVTYVALRLGCRLSSTSDRDHSHECEGDLLLDRCASG